MKLSNEIADITGGTSGIGLEAVKKRCMDLWLLKTLSGLMGIADPDVLKAIEEEEGASNCAPDQDSSK
jgi:NAD(P)-dependent dehydrogenase (short-subunit alcohol dehydrogenase family)